MGAAEMTSAVADVVTALATFGAVVVAGVGLKAWKKELKGRAEFDTARMLAKDTYALREALNGYRSPLWSSGEFPGGDMKSTEGLATMFQNRWHPLSETLARYDSTVLEAEALWGSNARQQTDRLRRCVIKVLVATEAMLDDKRADGEHFKADPQFGQRIRSEVAGLLDSDTNALSSEIRASVKAIEDLLKPHLSRS